MYKYILLSLFLYSNAFSQNFDNIVKTILSNNKELKAYEKYLNGIALESKFNNLPPNPEINYGIMKGSGIIGDNKQELIVSQPFEFPTVYSIKSDISSNQLQVNEQRLIEYMKKIVLTANNLLTDYLFQKKLISRYELRLSNYANILKSMELKFNNAEISILELNKTKSSIASVKSKLNLAVIELEYLKSSIIGLNGGQIIEIAINDIPAINLNFDRDSLITELQKIDYNNKLYYNEKELYQNKLRLSKSGWLPNFSVGYRLEREPGIDYSGVQISLSIPVFENHHKVPKAKSDLVYVELKQQAYNSEFKNNKIRLFDKLKLLEALVNEQKSIIDINQYDLLLKSFNLGQISLTEFYYENTIYFDIEDTILQSEKELYRSYSELLIEELISRFAN